MLGAAVEVSGGKVPVIAGVSEFTTGDGGASSPAMRSASAPTGSWCCPAMVYVPTAARTGASLPRGRRGNRAADHAVQQSALVSGQHRHRHARTAGRRAEHCLDQGVRARFAPFHRHHQCIRRSLRAVRGTRRCRLRRTDARRQGLGVRSHQCLPGRIAAAVRGAEPRATSSARAAFTAGSCRCCTWMRSTIWCSPSNSPNKSWAADRNGCGRRACRLPASAAPR